jgi:hypothetical protein
MRLYPGGLPWLAKPVVLREAVTAIVAAAHAARAFVGYLDFAGGTHWIAPHRQSGRRIVDRLSSDFDTPADNLGLAIDYLLGQRRDVPAASFVFVLSDFLRPPSPHVWSRARARNWDLVPVIVQDPVWEQSFPLVHSLLLPVTDPETGRTSGIRLNKREARERRDANEARLRDLVTTFRRLQFDPILLDTEDPVAVDEAFIRWSVRRRLARGRAA